MDYHSLNDQTVKNNYLLLLIMDLIDNMGVKEYSQKWTWGRGLTM